MFKAGFVGQQKDLGCRTHGRETGLLAPREALKQPGHPSPASSCLWGPEVMRASREGRGVAGLLARGLCSPSRDPRASGSKEVSTPPRRPAKTVNLEYWIPNAAPAKQEAE